MSVHSSLVSVIESNKTPYHGILFMRKLKNYLEIDKKNSVRLLQNKILTHLQYLVSETVALSSCDGNVPTTVMANMAS